MIFSRLLIHSITPNWICKKLKELIPDLKPRDDNTISYSNYKDSLVQQGYKEKQTTAAKENAVQKVQAPEGQEVAVLELHWVQRLRNTSFIIKVILSQK